MNVLSVLCSLFLPLAYGFPARQLSPVVSLPFSTSGRDIVTADGSKFYYAGTNWPGHQEVMIPEGLQYSSVQDIVSWIVKLGLNSVRLTYATQMVDEILDQGGDVGIGESLVRALGETNGTKVLAQVLEKNKEFTANTTRLEVFDAVARELARQGIILHLDNHVSKAIWCCGNSDGNGWFGEIYFDVDRWIRGWGFMANHASENWPSFASVGLRNELRSATSGEPYDWYTWYQHMTAAAEAVHKAAPNALIFFSGLNFDTTIQPIPLGQALNGTDRTATGGKTAYFDPTTFDYAEKIVLELHKYDFEHTQLSCSSFGNSLSQVGFLAVDDRNPETKFLFPVVLTEWGFAQDGVYWNRTTYNRCLIEFVDYWKVGWFQWELSGSFYVRTRSGVSIQDEDETWGLLNHEWNAVRSPVTVENSLQKMIDALS